MAIVIVLLVIHNIVFILIIIVFVGYLHIITGFTLNFINHPKEKNQSLMWVSNRPRPRGTVRAYHPHHRVTELFPWGFHGI